MRSLRFTIALLFLGVIFTAHGFAADDVINPLCDSNKKIGGYYHTSCFPWLESDLKLLGNTQHNDTPRLLRILGGTYYVGKIIFDENRYFINDSLPLYSNRIIVGSGRRTDYTDTYPSSRIIQTLKDKPIFTIGGGISNSAIRDIGLTSYLYADTRQIPDTTVGILAQNGTTDGGSLLSYNFEFSNISFAGLDKGIYVNAQAYGSANPQCQPNGVGCEGFWRFDNVKLDNADFSCRIGVHINSKNSGWSMKNVNLNVPAGSALQANELVSGSNTAYSFGLFLERIAYSTINQLIAGGPDSGSATAFIYVVQHANLNIQSSIDERFKNSVYVYGDSQITPINLSNNFFQSPLTVYRSSIVSTANRFNYDPSSSPTPAIANLGSRVLSFGDTFCNEANATCSDTRYATDSTSTLITASYDGSVTFGSVLFANLSSIAPSGTVVYCSNCNKGTPCSSGGSGAIAKRIGSSWDCD